MSLAERHWAGRLVMFSRWTTAVLVLGCGMFAAGLSRASADDAVDESDEPAEWQQQTSVAFEPSREIWAGVETFQSVWSIYTGSTYAPFGNLRQDGLRLRAVTAMSRFRYSGLRYDAARGDAVAVDFKGTSRTTDLYTGYQLGLGDTTVKLFAGWEIAAHLISPLDPETIVQGRIAGPKAALEIWSNMGPNAWLALDISYAKAFGAYASRARLGWRATETLSAGPEAAFIGHDESRMQRFGAFLRFDNGIDELSASAGWTKSQGDDGGAYVSAQWLRRF